VCVGKTTQRHEAARNKTTENKNLVFQMEEPRKERKRVVHYYWFGELKG